jgi:hypothetical protein
LHEVNNIKFINHIYKDNVESEEGWGSSQNATRASMRLIISIEDIYFQRAIWLKTVEIIAIFAVKISFPPYYFDSFFNNLIKKFWNFTYNSFEFMHLSGQWAWP